MPTVLKGITVWRVSKKRSKYSNSESFHESELALRILDTSW